MKLTKEERIAVIQLHGNGQITHKAVLQLFAQRYPNRPPPSQSAISKLLKKFRQTGSVEDRPRTGRRKTATGPESTKKVVATVGVNGRTSVRKLAKQLDLSRSSVHKILKATKFFPYKYQAHQKMERDDTARRSDFCQAMIELINNDPTLLRRILFSDEATIQLDGLVIKHNHRLWSQDNPRWLKENRSQYARKVSLWMGIIGKRTVGPFFLEGNLDGKGYLKLLQEKIIPALNAAFGGTDQIYYQQDGAPAHFETKVRDHLNLVFPGRWIGRCGPVAWPARSPDLSPLDYFAWSYVKERTFEGEPPQDIEELKTRISAAVAGIPKRALKNVVNAFSDRLYHCLTAGGGHFEHLL
jgi:transposase